MRHLNFVLVFIVGFLLGSAATMQYKKVKQSKQTKKRNAIYFSSKARDVQALNKDEKKIITSIEQAADKCFKQVQDKDNKESLEKNYQARLSSADAMKEGYIVSCFSDKKMIKAISFFRKCIYSSTQDLNLNKKEIRKLLNKISIAEEVKMLKGISVYY